jgi:glycerol-3-phosphate dehydrogenase
MDKMIWNQNWRDSIWSQLDQDWDMIVIGGGITGAGIFHQAVWAGLKVLLVEAHDFGAGTSSRSSKLVHGGLRYLKNAQIKITLESVKERQRLLRQGRGLINQLGFLHAHLEGDKLPGWVFRAGLILYDLMAHSWRHRHYDALDMRALCPALTTPTLIDGYRYFDAQTDDARLVLRLIREGVYAGGTAMNYARVAKLLRAQSGYVHGVGLVNQAPPKIGHSVEITSKVVVNAAGAWADELRDQIKAAPRLRLLRGSHLIIPSERLPLVRALSFLHPWNGRPVFAVPWEGVVLMGTTDVDHRNQAQIDPGISPKEGEYLLAGLDHVFPELSLSEEDVLATFSGIRPVIDTGKANPSKESRDHVIWHENGLLTVSGGKLTTFRLMARDALKALRRQLPEHRHFNLERAVFSASSSNLSSFDLPPPVRLRLEGRYGAEAHDLIAAADLNELTPFAKTPTLRAELRWAARAEGIVHLDDLLLRRTRLGLLLSRGGTDRIFQIKPIAQPELGWSDEKWEQEVNAYKELWMDKYQYPTGS